MYFNTKNTESTKIQKISVLSQTLSWHSLVFFIYCLMSPSLQHEAICNHVQSTHVPRVLVQESVCIRHASAAGFPLLPADELACLSGHEWGNQSPIPCDFHSNSCQTGDPPRYCNPGHAHYLDLGWARALRPLIALPSGHGAARLDQGWLRHVLPCDTMECACPALSLLLIVPKLPLAAEGGCRRQIFWKKEPIATSHGL